MDFDYVIEFTVGDRTIRRHGHGMFFPHDGGFNLEHMLWLMTEEFGRPDMIVTHMKFIKLIA